MNFLEPFSNTILNNKGHSLKGTKRCMHVNHQTDTGLGTVRCATAWIHWQKCHIF